MTAVHPWTPAWFTGKRITVMGLGLHGGGLAVASWMLRRGADVTVTDLKTRVQLASSVRAVERVAKERGSGALTLVLGRHRAADLAHADLVVQNPGVPRASPYLAAAKRAGVSIENEASVFFRILDEERRTENGEQRRMQVVGVTGTRGKSTTAALIAAILRAGGRRVFLAGNNRIPMFGEIDAILRAAKRGPVTVVLELSSWHCERLTTETGSADVAVITNIMRDHLNRYHTMRAYAAAKSRLLQFQHTAVSAICNRSDTIVRRVAQLYGRNVRWFSDRPAARAVYPVGEWLVERAGDAEARVARRGDLALPGAHNTRNACAAIAAARAVGVSGAAIRRGLQSFRGLPGRLEVIAQRNGITWINDTCATTPDAVIAALLSFQERNSKNQIPNSMRKQSIILIAGGTDKELMFDAWARVVAASVKAIVFLPGTATAKMERALGRVEGAPPAHQASSMRAAVRISSRLAHRGDTILLSPGAASFGLFVHEFDRGEQFAASVK